MWSKSSRSSRRMVGRSRPGCDGVAQTKIIENAVRQQRATELSRDFNRNIERMRAWDALACGHWGDKVHRFEAVEWESEVLPRGAKDLGTKGFFHPRGKGPPAELNRISSRPTAGWYSPSAFLSIQQREDLALLRWCHSSGGWEAGSRCWLGMLSGGPNLCIRFLGGDGPAPSHH